MVFEPVASIHGMQKQLSSQNILGEKNFPEMHHPHTLARL
jgi:hypothetical protein